MNTCPPMKELHTVMWPACQGKFPYRPPQQGPGTAPTFCLPPTLWVGTDIVGTWPPNPPLTDQKLIFKKWSYLVTKLSVLSPVFYWIQNLYPLWFLGHCEHHKWNYFVYVVLLQQHILTIHFLENFICILIRGVRCLLNFQKFIILTAPFFYCLPTLCEEKTPLVKYVGGPSLQVKFVLSSPWQSSRVTLYQFSTRQAKGPSCHILLRALSPHFNIGSTSLEIVIHDRQKVFHS